MVAIRCATLIKLILLAIVVGFAISDFVLDREYTDDSSKWSASTQKSGGSGLETISNLLSTVAVYWVLLFFHFYVVFTKDIPYMVYTVVQYFLGLTTTLVLKALYYRGRPFVIAADVQGCQCDPGMPSGHATMAVLTYWILYDQIDRNWIINTEPLTKRRVYRFILGTLCCIIAAAVIFSRVALGVHTWSQLLIGAAVGLFIITFLTYDLWCSVYLKILPSIASWMSGYALSLLAFSIAMIFINHGYREKPDYWRYFSKCTPCLGSFVYGQSQSLGLAFFQMGFMIRFPLKDGLSLSTQRSVFTIDQKVKRYFLYLALMVPAILLVGIYEFVIKREMNSNQTSVTLQSLLGLFVYGISTFYLGYATSHLRLWVFKMFSIDRDDLDILHKDDLLKKQAIAEDTIQIRLPHSTHVDSSTSNTMGMMHAAQKHSKPEQEQVKSHISPVLKEQPRGLLEEEKQGERN
jgi:membrane-associated phospholipid phosphatase